MAAPPCGPQARGIPGCGAPPRARTTARGRGSSKPTCRIHLRLRRGAACERPPRAGVQRFPGPPLPLDRRALDTPEPHLVAQVQPRIQRGRVLLPRCHPNPRRPHPRHLHLPAEEHQTRRLHRSMDHALVSGQWSVVSDQWVYTSHGESALRFTIDFCVAQSRIVTLRLFCRGGPPAPTRVSILSGFSCWGVFKNADLRRPSLGAVASLP